VPTAERNNCDRKDIFWAFVFGSRIAHIWALSQMSLCTHNSDHSLYNYFSISVQFFPRMAPHFLKKNDSPSNLAESHGSKPVTRSKISEISQWQKCFSELKISNPRISCTLNEVRRSSWKVVRVTKWSNASETSFKWQIFCSCSWQAIDICYQEKSNINFILDRFYLLANFSGIESRVFIENWKWVSKGCGSYLIHPGKLLAFPPL